VTPRAMTDCRNRAHEQSRTSAQRKRFADNRLRAGDVVRVKTPAQIAIELEEDGTSAGMPFMHEMLSACGGTYTVAKSAHKTCDSAASAKLRGLDATVHLDGLRCDGSAHGGCQLGCLLYWKTAWLESARDRDLSADQPSSVVAKDAFQGLDNGRRLHGRDPNRGTYSCQSTEVPYASQPLPPSALSQYWRDVRSRNTSVVGLVRTLMLMLADRSSSHVRASHFYAFLRTSAGRKLPWASRHPTGPLNHGIHVGDIVSVRTNKEIRATLDSAGRNRGLTFEAGMSAHCGKQGEVVRRVEKIIDERSGRLRELHNDCFVLEGVVCNGSHNRSCPRSAYLFWRGVWLNGDTGKPLGRGLSLDAPRNV